MLTEIIKQHSKEIWSRIAKYIGPPIDSRAHHITQWLRGGGFWGAEYKGALSEIDMEAVWQWVDENIEERAWYIASFVPKMLFREEGRVCWAREVLVRYGSREDVRRNFSANFSSEGWTGPESTHFQNKKQELLTFREGEDSENVQRWIDEYVSQLDQRIDQAKIMEEREAF